jgi:hypothetical protein
MKKIILLIVISAFAKAKAQPFVIDTLKNAQAFSSSYIPMDVFGKTRSGHIYTCGLNNRYTFKGPLPVQLVRIDMTDNTVTYKEIEGTLSSPTILLRWAFDEAGNFYAGFNTNNQKIYKFNLKDSIYYKNIGNGFLDGKSVPYAMQLGRDGHIYCGGVGGKTYVSEYNPATAKWIEYPYIDPINNYTLSVAGDSDYIYAQTGQINSVQLWAMKKSDSTRKMLFKITNLTRIGLYTRKDGIYAEVHSDTLSGIYKLVHGKPMPVRFVASTDMAHNDLETNTATIPKIVSHFDAGENIFSYSINNSPYQNLHIETNNLRDPLRLVFGFKNDEKNIYYAGEHYGNYYRYNLAEGKSYLLGSTNFNIYSLLPDTDSTIYLSNYPSAGLLKWNRNKPWTLGKFINGVVVTASRKSNPEIIGYFKGQTAAGFHYPYATVRDFKNNVVSAGQVERIANTCSIAVYDPAKDSLYGYDFNKMKAQAFSGLAVYQKHVILSTNNANGGVPKLYYYNSITNKMDDSLMLGFKDYGKIYISGEILTGIANDRIYKLNLATKKLIQNTEFAARSITASFMLADGTIIINTTNNLPEGFAKFIKFKCNSYWETKDFLYATDGLYLVRIKKPLE